jgi:hypothetical protein
MNTTINIVFFQPDLPRLHNLRGYEDVIDTVAYGLKLLGWEAHVTRNYKLASCQQYMLFGWLAMPIANLSEFPVGTIVYNLEQFENELGVPYEMLFVNLQFAINNFQIFEYSRHNGVFWDQYALRFPVFLAPIAFSENQIMPLSAKSEDIDVLYYGGFGGTEKLRFLQAATGEHLVALKTMILHNFYAEQRNEFISRAKVILSFTSGHILPLVRIGFLLANRKAVVSSISPTDLIDDIDEGLRRVLIFATAENVAAKIKYLLSDDQVRNDYADSCHECFRQRRIEDVLRPFFN